MAAQVRANHNWSMGIGERGLTIGYWEPSILLFYTFKLVARHATGVRVCRIIHWSVVVW